VLDRLNFDASQKFVQRPNVEINSNKSAAKSAKIGSDLSSSLKLDGKIQTHSSRASSEHETVEPGSIKKRDEEIHKDARKNSINLN